MDYDTLLNIMLAETTDLGKNEELELNLYIQSKPRELPNKQFTYSILEDDGDEPLNNWNIHKVGGREFALQLTLYQEINWYNINNLHLIKSVSGKNKGELAPLSFWAEHFNTLSLWVSTILLTAANDKLRSQILKKLVEELEVLKNVYAITAICLSLFSPMVSRHKPAKWTRFMELESFKRFEVYVSFDNNYKFYRELIRSDITAFIPQLSVHLSDLIHIWDASPSKTDGKINLAKFFTFSTEVDNICQFRTTNVINGGHPRIKRFQDFVSNLEVISEDDQFACSKYWRNTSKDPAVPEILQFYLDLQLRYKKHSASKGGFYEGERRGELLTDKLSRLSELQSTIQQLTLEIEESAPIPQPAGGGGGGAGTHQQGAGTGTRALVRTATEVQNTSRVGNLYNVTEKTGTDRLVGLRNAVLHIIDTEQAYVKDMELFLEEFYSPLTKSGIIPTHALTTLFSGVLEKIIACNQQFLSDLTTKRDYLEKLEEEELSKGDDTVALKEFDISKIFQSWATSLPLYILYCINRASGVDTQIKDLKEDNPEFLEFITVKGAHILQKDKDSNKTEYRGFSLEEWLDKPRKRLNKYPILIKDVLEYSVEGTESYSTLEQLLKSVFSALFSVNKAQKRQEELQTLEMDYFMLLDKCVRDLGVLATSSLPSAFPENIYKPGRKIVHYAQLTRVNNEGFADNPHVKLFLMSDIILLCGFIEGEPKLNLESIIGLMDAKISLWSDSNLKNALGLLNTADPKSKELILVSPNKEAFDQLLLRTKKQIKEYQMQKILRAAQGGNTVGMGTRSNPSGPALSVRKTARPETKIQYTTEELCTVVWNGNMPEFTKMMDGIAAAPPDAASKVINGLNSRGQCPLYCAARQGHVSILLVLLDFPGIDLNKPSIPHKIAGYSGHADIVALLLAKGANHKLLNHQGLAPRAEAVGHAKSTNALRRMDLKALKKAIPLFANCLCLKLKVCIKELEAEILGRKKFLGGQKLNTKDSVHDFVQEKFLKVKGSQDF